MTNKTVGNGLQSMDYNYNIRGWLTDINKNQMAVPNLDNKLFSYKIKYTQKEGMDNPDSVQFPGKNVSAKYNGNIAEVDWRAVETIGVNPLSTPKRYGYVYDSLNRLTAGYYQNPLNPTSKENTESLSYDLNGNISSLYRTTVVESGNTTATLIDNLEYVYETGNKSNKLTNINDYAYNYTGYEGNGNTIDYDLNGNMINMPDKGIGTIEYNHLNLPKHLEYEKVSNEYVVVDTKYGADGSKRSKTNTTTIFGFNGYTTATRITDYLDGFQYLSSPVPITPPGGGGDPELLMATNSETARALEVQAFTLDGGSTTKNVLGVKTADLQFFPTTEGFYDYTKDQYIYQYKDHLGNTRVSFGRNSLGNLEIVDNNDYYPFGMNHLKSGASFFGTSSYKNYKYSGKELQESGMYDYGVRMYMPDLGRWGVVDPLAEKHRRHSPYNYAVNNPIMFIDPDGRDIRFGDQVYTYKKNRDYSEYKGFEKSTYEALDYLYSTGALNVTIGEGNEARTVNIMDEMIKDDKNTFTILEQKVSGKKNEFDPNSKSVKFNPAEGIRFRKDGTKSSREPGNDGYNSPSSRLGHEIIHGYNLFQILTNIEIEIIISMILKRVRKYSHPMETILDFQMKKKNIQQQF